MHIQVGSSQQRRPPCIAAKTQCCLGHLLRNALLLTKAGPGRADGLKLGDDGHIKDTLYAMTYYIE